MGIVDQFVITIKCPHCEVIEDGKVLDKGSTWSGSSWSNRTNFIKFKVTWQVSNVDGPPTVDKAICTECGADAEVSSSFRA